MKTFNEFLVESVLRYTWDNVSPDEVENYKDWNGLKITKESNKLYVATKNDKVIFRYDLNTEKLYSDFTIMQLEDGRAK